MRWIRKFINGADGKPFFYENDESKKERILGDLQKGVIVLTEDDIKLLAKRRRTLDAYMLLFEHGYITLENYNIHLYKHSIEYLSEFWFLGEAFPAIRLSLLAKKIREILILRDANHLRHFLYYLPSLMNYYAFQAENRFLYFPFFLSELLQSEAARKLCWEPFTKDLLNHYETQLGKDHFLTTYFRNTYLPQYTRMYKAEKQLQKESIDSLKEELMAFTWHPDRFLTWCLDEDEKKEHQMLFG